MEYFSSFSNLTFPFNLSLHPFSHFQPILGPFFSIEKCKIWIYANFFLKTQMWSFCRALILLRNLLVNWTGSILLGPHSLLWIFRARYIWTSDKFIHFLFPNHTWLGLAGIEKLRNFQEPQNLQWEQSSSWIILCKSIQQTEKGQKRLILQLKRYWYISINAIKIKCFVLNIFLALHSPSAIFHLLALLIFCGGRYYKSTVGNQYPQSI